MLTHQVPIQPKSTQDHRNSLSLLSTCIPDSFNPCLLPCPLNGIQNLKPIKATHRYPVQAQRLPATVDRRGQEKEKRIPPTGAADSALGRLRRPSEVGVSMPRRGKLANVHEEERPVSECAMRWGRVSQLLARMLHC